MDTAETGQAIEITVSNRLSEAHGKGGVTVLQLLTHQGGFPRLAKLAGLMG